MVKELSPKEKKALEAWDKLVKDILNETEIEDLTPAEIQKKRKELESDPVKWTYYFFPKGAKYKFAAFHIKAIRRIISHDNWYEVLSWSRELAKSSTIRFVVLYLALTGKISNIILASATEDSAERLLRPYRAHLEANQRIRQFYGDQKGSLWTSTEFVTKKGVSFLGVGAGNTPRGTINDDVRPDCLLIDDFDTDEACRNPETIEKNWKWFEEALYFTRSFSEPLRTIWCGNVIAKDCCITRAGTRAMELSAMEIPLGNWDIINIRMVDINKPDPENDYRYGASVWPDKNSEQAIDLVLAQVSGSAAQKECFNNPVFEGLIFESMRWDVVPPIDKFQFLISYADPAPSNTVNKKLLKNQKASYKANFLMGVLDGKLYVITGFLDRVVNEEFIKWFYYHDRYAAGRVQIYNYIENNKLQDPFFQQVFKPLWAKVKLLFNKILSLIPDERRKPDKAVRIDSLSALNREGNLILNIAEKNNPHMKRLEEQFINFNLQLSFPADGPDTIEGGLAKANEKLSQLGAGGLKSFGKSGGSKRV
jgi:phage terminase large subunit-like protein